MELRLISASSRTVPPLSCNITFCVPDSIQSLPVWRLWDQDITPFRDRTMVEKICSISEVQADMKRIMDDISKELLKHKDNVCVGEEVDRVVCSIGITCRDGTRVSPCYVERLYEEYLHRAPIGELTVKREHQHISPYVSREPSKGRLFIWQRTKIPLNVCKFEDFTVERLWSAFPFHMTATIEESFKRDPFNRNLKLMNGGSQCVFNFETGEMFSEHRNKMFRFRCTVSIIEARITCKLLGHASYKSVVKHYDAAGILFYSTHPVTVEPVFLLGHMTYGSESWCDFGGLKHFWERPRHTAARECSEETFGVLGGVEQLFEMLGNYQTNNVFKVINEGTAYVGHFMWVPYGDYPRKFDGAIQNAEETMEVDEMRWFSLYSLASAMKTFAMQQSNMAHPILENGKSDITSCCPLRYEFLQTLCIAEKLGFLHHIQHICTQRHAQSPAGSTQCESKSDSETKLCDHDISGSEVSVGTRQRGHATPEHCCGLEVRTESLGLQAGSSAGNDPERRSCSLGSPPSASATTTAAAREEVKEQPLLIPLGEEGGGAEGRTTKQHKSKELSFGMGAGNFTLLH